MENSDLDVRLSFAEFVTRDQARQVRYLQAVSAGTKGPFSVVRLVNARVPVLRLLHKNAIEVDLTMGEEVACASNLDSAIKSVLSGTRGIRGLRLVQLVKLFARAHGLIDAFAGYLNSASWVLLVLEFMQGKGLVRWWDDEE